MAASRVRAIQAAILRWYRRNGRDLPWRRTRDPYAILVAEIMLQQTQVDRVIPKYVLFLARFPTAGALARARLRDVLRVWSGLGYNARARRLWECARAVVNEHRGRVPGDVAALQRLPGIGRYTAAAIACFAFDAPEAIVETNSRRVLTRALDGTESVGERRVWELARRSLPAPNAHDWNQALMDVGALVCRPLPRCAACPIARHCRGRHVLERKPPSKPRPPRAPSPPYAGSRRFFRGRIVSALARVRSLSLEALGRQVKPGFDKTELPWLKHLLVALRRDGLVALDLKRKRAALP